MTLNLLSFLQVRNYSKFTALHFLTLVFKTSILNNYKATRGLAGI